MRPPKQKQPQVREKGLCRVLEHVGVDVDEGTCFDVSNIIINRSECNNNIKIIHMYLVYTKTVDSVERVH